MIVEQQRRLEQSEVAIDLHRCQGAIGILRRIKFMREKLMAVNKEEDQMIMAFMVDDGKDVDPVSGNEVPPVKVL